MTREELYKAAKSILHEDFCLNGKCPYYDQCERGEGHVPAHKFSCNHDFALSMIIRGIDLTVYNQTFPWISVKDDLPCNHEEMIDNSVSPRIETIVVITYDESNEIDDNFMYKKDGIWKWKKYPKPKYWCLYPEPPKE